MGHFESVFIALFSCGIYIVNKQDSKNMVLNKFDFMIKSLYAQYLSWNISKILIFRNARKPASSVPILRPLPILAQLYW